MKDPGNWVIWSGAGPETCVLYRLFEYAEDEGILSEFDLSDAAVLMQMPGLDEPDGELLRPYLNQLIALGAISVDDTGNYTVHREPPASYTGPRSTHEWFDEFKRRRPGGQA